MDFRLVAGFLSIGELMRCREVSKEWNERVLSLQAAHLWCGSHRSEIPLTVPLARLALVCQGLSVSAASMASMASAASAASAASMASGTLDELMLMLELAVQHRDGGVTLSLLKRMGRSRHNTEEAAWRVQLIMKRSDLEFVGSIDRYAPAWITSHKSPRIYKNIIRHVLATLQHAAHSPNADLAVALCSWAHSGTHKALVAEDPAYELPYRSITFFLVRGDPLRLVVPAPEPVLGIAALRRKMIFCSPLSL